MTVQVQVELEESMDIIAFNLCLKIYETHNKKIVHKFLRELKVSKEIELEIINRACEILYNGGHGYLTIYLKH